MAKSLEEIVAKLPRHRQRKIANRVAELTSLRELRSQSGLTQNDVAANLGVGQETVSKLESRGDMRVSTLRRYIESLGGRLECVACFPDNSRVVIDETAKPSNRRGPAV